MDDPVVEEPLAVASDVASDAPAPTAAPADPFDDTERTTFDRGYVEQVRRDAANYRNKAKELEERLSPWKDALEGWEPDDQQAVKELLAAVKKGDRDAITAILGLDDGAVAPDVTTAPQPGDPGYLTPADFDRLLEERLSEREQKAELDRQVKAIESEAKELGYEQGSNDYALLFKIAHEQTDGDLKAADEQLKAWKQSFVDQFVASKANAPTPPPSSGGPASGERQILTLDDAKKAALERFNASPVNQ